MKNSVLFLTNAYPDFSFSHRGIFIKKIVSLLCKEGYQVAVVTPKIYKKSRNIEDQNGTRVYRFPFLSGDKLLIEYEKIPYLKMILYFIAGFFSTVCVFLKHKCCLIHAHWAIPTGLIGVWVSMIFRKPLIVTIHGSDLRMALKKKGFLRKIFIYVCKSAAHLNCVSEIQKKEIEQLGIVSEKITIIPMGVDEAFLEIGKDRKLDLNKRPFVILSNRNLLPIYNVSLLIRAIPKILKEEPTTKFVIAGNGSEKQKLEQEVENLDLSDSVRFLGQIPNKEMPNLLGQADIYVSTALFDGTSVSLLEAMASGALPIVTDIPANREWIVDGVNGFLVPEEEEDFLANKIIYTIRNPELLGKSQAQNCVIIKKKALWPEYIKKVRNIYANVLSS
jgi:glycosyltransferase involved in cell wall biosynthesis